MQLGTLLLGPVVCGSHMMFVYLWTYFAISAIMVHHSGFDWGMADYFPGIGSMAHFHDYHHMVFNKNFGTLGILDIFHQTYGGYFKHVEKWKEERKQEREGKTTTTDDDGATKKQK